MTTTNPPAAQAGSYRVGDLDLNRIGYGAMQLAGPGVFGPPPDRAAAIELLRTAVELGVNHIDTADAYGPYITNEIIREALFPYDNVHIVTKVGIIRDEQGGWLPGNSPQSLRAQVHDNLRRLGLDVLDVVNLRTLGGIDDRATVPGELARQFEALAGLRQQGLIRHLGLSAGSLVPRLVLRAGTGTATERPTLCTTAANRHSQPACSPNPGRWQGLAGTSAGTAVRGISVLRCSGRANHHDPVTPPNLPRGKHGRGAPPGREIFSSALTWASPPGVPPGGFQPKGDAP